MSDEKKKILTMGMAAHRDTALMRHALGKMGDPPIVIIPDNDSRRTIIEVNGEKWELIDEEQNRRWKGSSRMPHIMAATMAMAGSLSFVGRGHVSSGEPMPTYQLEYLINEYALIQRKESSLSRRERHWVTHQFETKFKKLP